MTRHDERHPVVPEPGRLSTGVVGLDQMLGGGWAPGDANLVAGSPGTGKTMLARRLPSILPPLTRAEAIEVTRIQSVAGLYEADGLVQRRPFRAPHHTISASGLVGGGPLPVPGE
ncbi:MAG: ATP-binding protein, partial [Thermoplasmatota archaeon]